MRISLSKSDRSFDSSPGESLLDAALGAGLRVPYGCKGGSCGACRARLLEGEIVYPSGPPLGLSAADIAEGFILLCRARAITPLQIDTVEITPADVAQIKRLPARIERAVRVAPDVLGAYLRLPAAETFSFQPGQYVDILLSGGRRRSFSIASPPHDAKLLELHIRRVNGGEFTDRLFTADPCNRLLNIEGPLGDFVYRPAAAPLLLVGGGTGLAPLKSILRHVVETGVPRDVTLYWGVRSEHDLYAHAELSALAERAAGFRYHPVLSEPLGAWPGRRGLVHEAVLRDGVPLDTAHIYASGPPLMIDAVRRHFGGHAADSARLYVESFDYAPDSAARHATTAATKS